MSILEERSERCTGCVVLEDEEGNLIEAIVEGCPVHDRSEPSASYPEGGEE
jgi:hypothetical protein